MNFEECFVVIEVSNVPSAICPDVLAAILYAQLEVRNAVQEARRKRWLSYYEGLVMPISNRALR
jgi:hypothetical protein